MRCVSGCIEIALLAVLVLACSCTPQITGPGGSVIDAVGAVVSDATGDDDTADGSGPVADDADPPAGGGSSDEGAVSDPASDAAATAQPQVTNLLLSGSVSTDTYQLFELGSSSFGDQWRVTWPSASGGGYFLVVLLDQDQNLLRRELVSSWTPLEHVLRGQTPMLYAGVAAAYGTSGGNFRLLASLDAGRSVPSPRRQVVWVNFGAGSNVHVHVREGISFPSFDGAMLGADYAGETGVIKAAILAAMREDYAAYNVVVMSSDEGGPPGSPYATIHIGGNDSRLLGLADNVDQYNSDLGQTAVVFVEAFADFAVMRLTPDEMGQMIGNVASHELGHLIGLFHTACPEDLMDTTGTAWDLAENQSFIRGPLEATVFPTGYEDCPARLLETVGAAPGSAKAGVTKRLLSETLRLRKAELRAMVRDALHHRCGTCLNPDG